MRILAIETATEACSVALFENGALVGARHVELGRGHAERLVPMIAELPEKGRAEEIRVSLGPGSFTGVRIGLAAARSLGVAWNARVRGFPTLALVAATARQDHEGALDVCMNGGHGEWFVQQFDANGLPAGPLASLPPPEAVGELTSVHVAGNRADSFAEEAKREVVAINLLPDARHVLSLPSQLLLDELAPIYGRAPDAKLPAR
jgi:tRNA threonylcarbamoyl adenosine modification protein YeaZ